MNCLYFLCRDHGVYLDAGYRWAYWHLEHTGLVTQGEPVDVTAVMGAKAYWDPTAEERSDYLTELLPRVRAFLDEHAGHDLLYVDEDWVYQKWELGYEYRELGG